MKLLNLYTTGGQYYLIGGTVEYIGYYNVDDTLAYTGRSFDETSILLTPISVDVISYKTVSQTTLPDYAFIFIPAPTDADYKRGWFIRYFARQTNVLLSTYLEIDETQYNDISGGQKPFYTSVNLRWKITGPMFDVVDSITMRVIEPGVSNTNDRSIKLIEASHPMLRNRLQNLVEFWKGGSSPYFAPPLTEVSGTLRYEKK